MKTTLTPVGTGWLAGCSCGWEIYAQIRRRANRLAQEHADKHKGKL